MTPMDPRARVGDADREETVAALQRYLTEGYLSLDEFSDRSAAAYRAITHGELAALTGDLAPAAHRQRDRDTARVTDPRSWSPAMIAVVVVVGVALLAAAAVAVMMFAMMSGMDMGDMEGMGMR